MKPLFILVGPSATGKTTIANRIVCNTGMSRAITATTRQPREGEPLDSYAFLTPEEFEAMDMVESTAYNGNRYGTPRQSLEKADLIILDPVGAVKVREALDRPCYIIGLSAPSKVRAARMAMRGDSMERLDVDEEHFKQFNDCYDYVVNEPVLGIAYLTVLELMLRCFSEEEC